MKKRTAWIIVIAVFVLIAAVVLLSYYLKKEPFQIPLPEGAYRVAEVVYDCGIFDFSETPDNAPRFCYADGKWLWDAEPGSVGWTEIGPLSLYEREMKPYLEPFFDGADGMWSGGYSAEVLYDYALWGGLAENQYGFFLLLDLKGGPGGPLLCRGFYDRQQPFVRWVERLEWEGADPVPVPVSRPLTDFTIWVDAFTEGFDPSAAVELTLPEYPGVVFRYTRDEVTANGKRLISGMPVFSVYLADLTGDGKRELCASWAMGSGIVNEGVTVYDYAAGTPYVLQDRMKYDFAFEAVDGTLTIKKTPYMDWTRPPEEQQAVYGVPALADGRLVMIGTPISE